MVDVLRCAHHGKAVAILEVERVGGKELDVASHYAAYVYAVGLAHVQRAERFRVELGACHDDDAALDGGVDGVPVNLVAVPVLLHVFSEEDVHDRHLVTCGDYEDVVVLHHDGLRHRHDNLAVSPDARDDEVAL